MWTNDFKNAIREVESRLFTACSSGRVQDSVATRKEVLKELYLLLHSAMAERYFSVIYRRTGACNCYVGKEIGDYLTELWMEVYERYDPRKGTLLEFLTSRLQNRIIDDERKMGGIVGLPRLREDRVKIRLLGIVHTDYGEIPDELSISESQFNQEKSGIYEGKETWFEKEHDDLLAGDCLHALAKQILALTGAGTALESKVQGKDGMGTASCRLTGAGRYSRNFYYQLFYSSDVLSFLKESGNEAAFQHVREEMAAMHFSFTNFCTDRGMQYCCQEEITPATILAKSLAKNSDVLPRALQQYTDYDARIAVPIKNEVIRGYMERVEGRKVSSSNISQMRRKYLDEICRILKM